MMDDKAVHAFVSDAGSGYINSVTKMLNETPGIINLKENRQQCTALQLASMQGRMNVMELLLKKGADLNLQNIDGYTALILASRDGQAAAVKLLLEKGANVNMQGSKNGFTALHCASSNGHAKIVTMLLSSGADKGETALQLAKNDVIRQALLEVMKTAAAPSQAAIQAVLQQGDKEWGRSRIMLVGQGRAGKTALCNSLIGKSYRETESTVGINQLMCDIHYASSGGDSKGWNEYTKPVKELEAAVASMLVHAKKSPPEKKVAKATAPALREDESMISAIAVAASRHTPDHRVSASPAVIPQQEAVAMPSIDEELVMNCLANSITTESDLVVSVYDYGGQSVFNVIHHLFLTQNGVYVLAFNMEWLQRDGDEKEQCLSYLKFWTNSIWIHTHNAATGRAAPIALVGTRKDRIKSPKDHERISTLLHGTFAHTKIWPSVLPNKQGQGINGTTLLYFYPVDNTRGRSDVTVCQLLTKLEETMNGNAFTRKKVPLSWLRAVDEMQATKKPCLSLDMVYDIATKKCGVSQDHVPYLLHFLHEMGIALWNDEPGLREVVILDAVSYLVLPATRVICKHVPDVSDGTSHMLDVHTDCSQQYFNEWAQLTSKGVLDAVILDVLWRDVISERDVLLKLMVKFGLVVPVSSSSRKRRHAQSEAATKYIVPALLPHADPTSAAMREWTDKPNQTCFFVFAASSDLGESSVLLQQDIMRDGFLPTGLFERVVGKVISWSLATTKAGKFNIHNVTLQKELAILSFGAQRFRMTLCPQINSIRVDIEGTNPVVVQDRLLYLIELVMKECMRSLNCFSAVLYCPTATSTIIPAMDVESFCFGKNDALLLLPVDAIRDAADSRSVLTRKGGRQLISDSSDVRRLFEVWLKVFGQEDRYDVFISYRWGDFDGAFVSGLYDMFTNYSFGASNRPIEVFLDKKRLKEGRQFDADFALALTRSSVVVPMVSPEALQRLITHDPTTVDNLLLEWILCLQCYNNTSCRTKAVFPFAFGSRGFNESNEVIVQSLFASDVLSKLPHVIPTATLERGTKFLKENNVAIADINSYKALTVNSIVNELMKFLCFQSWNYDAGDVLEEGADKVLEILRGMPEDMTAASSAPRGVTAAPNSSTGCDAIWTLLQDKNSFSDITALHTILSEAEVLSANDVLTLDVDTLEEIGSIMKSKPYKKFKLRFAWELLRTSSFVQNVTAMQATLDGLGICNEKALTAVDEAMFEQIAAHLKAVQKKTMHFLLLK